MISPPRPDSRLGRSTRTSPARRTSSSRSPIARSRSASRSSGSIADAAEVPPPRKECSRANAALSWNATLSGRCSSMSSGRSASATPSCTASWPSAGTRSATRWPTTLERVAKRHGFKLRFPVPVLATAIAASLQWSRLRARRRSEGLARRGLRRVRDGGLGVRDRSAELGSSRVIHPAVAAHALQAPRERATSASRRPSTPRKGWIGWKIVTAPEAPSRVTTALLHNGSRPPDRRGTRRRVRLRRPGP